MVPQKHKNKQLQVYELLEFKDRLGQIDFDLWIIYSNFE